MGSDDNNSWVDFGVAGNDGGDQLHRLWAPYRQEYYAQAPRKIDNEPSDPFLDAPRGDDRENHIIARGKHVYAILNLYPYNSGHLMVIPYRKVAELENLTVEEANELMAFTQKAVRVLKRVSRPDACNIGMNLGKAAGGSIGDHLHMHIVPRWVGDTNFMPVIGGAKVMPATLEYTWELLAQGWRGIDDEDAATTQSEGVGEPGA